MRPCDIPPLLGIAQKAGKIVSGQETVERAIFSGKVRLVIISEDASINTRDRFSSLCRSRGVNYIVFGHSEILGRSIGRDGRKVIGVIDRCFSEEILKRFNAIKSTEVGYIVENKSVRTGEKVGNIQ
ncbi:L7Ae/L30e/S12e/Gadd45 family ribosomal protein [Thermosediminibacter litoriperuensis]|uniref:Ribosomal protein L7Ae-like RNA K-turn-binding protein n=1 Tax=Thermosediminibacter litoriperuensis TaxID=291989 RepID=A0A5S5AQI0_9FIRM|nr:ribosomal L7Ae/L30e/S12e/Gadd45 family protein [Thermosediminibacter litoriperuensis]TYP54293.1 ribosomal protein L7Ae-like RNA K-turn-binding protein [Thermosediminibacter litoriperuensis]